MITNITPADWPYYTPENTVLYAIGDLHGNLDEHNMLYAILENEIAKSPEKEHIIIYLGDYVDRGPDSKKLIDRLIRIQNNDSPAKHIFLKGNHENGFIGYLDNPLSWTEWIQWGGVQTAQSYGINIQDPALIPSEHEQLQRLLLKNMPPEHYSFLNLLELKYVAGDYAFVHAGIQPGIPLEEQEEQDLTFIREPFLSWPHPHEKCIVHGHTITKEPEISLSRIGIDTGLYMHGILTCAIFEDNTVSVLQINANDL